MIDKAFQTNNTKTKNISKTNGSQDEMSQNMDDKREKIINTNKIQDTIQYKP